MNIWMCYCCVDFKRREHSNKRDAQKEKWRISSIVNNDDDDDDDTKTTHVGQKTRMCVRVRSRSSKKDKERMREKKERKRQANCHFNQPYLSGFCLVFFLYVGTFQAKKERKREKTLLLQLLVNWIESLGSMCLSMIMLREELNRCSSRQAPSFIPAQIPMIECRKQVKWPD
jgi:hypothetical protein